MHEVFQRDMPGQALMDACGDVIHLRKLLQNDGLATVFAGIGDAQGISTFGCGHNSLLRSNLSFIAPLPAIARASWAVFRWGQSPPTWAQKAQEDGAGRTWPATSRATPEVRSESAPRTFCEALPAPGAPTIAAARRRRHSALAGCCRACTPPRWRHPASPPSTHPVRRAEDESGRGLAPGALPRPVPLDAYCWTRFPPAFRGWCRGRGLRFARAVVVAALFAPHPASSVWEPVPQPAWDGNHSAGR